MDDPVFEVLWLLLKMFGILFLIDVALYLLLWRVQVHNKNITRRHKERQAKASKTRDDIFWSEQRQEDLYSDFKRAA